MAVSDDQYQAILVRLRKTENVLNDVLVAINSFVTVNQLTQLSVITQTDVQALHVEVDAIQRRVQTIEEDPTG
jgi:polyhydroxyalkanoate synthesis regulator phasin